MLIPAFTKASDAWRWLAAQYENRADYVGGTGRGMPGLVRGLCGVTLEIAAANLPVGGRLRAQLHRWLGPDPKDQMYRSAFWWGLADWGPDQPFEDRALACAWLATMAEEEGD